MNNANTGTQVLITENLEVHANKVTVSWIAHSYVYPMCYTGSRSYLQECFKQRFSYRVEPGQNKPAEILKGPGIAIERPSVY